MTDGVLCGRLLFFCCLVMLTTALRDSLPGCDSFLHLIIARIALILGPSTFTSNEESLRGILPLKSEKLSPFFAFELSEILIDIPMRFLRRRHAHFLSQVL